MIFTIVLRYVRLSMFWLTLLYIPMFSIAANYPEYEYEQSYKILKTQYPWLTLPFYYKICLMAPYYKLDPALCCSLIHSESYHRIYRPILKQMKWAVSKSGAMSYWQVMPVHYPKDPKALLRDTTLNFHKGMGYLRKCISFSKGDLRESLRRYNQGIHGRRNKYLGWNTYVKPILRRYTYSLSMINKPKPESGPVVFAAVN